jgi:hypothetical protein
MVLHVPFVYRACFSTPLDFAGQGKGVAQLYTELVKDMEKGKTTVQQAQQDLRLAAAATKAVGGIWGSKTVAAAVTKAQIAVAKQQLLCQGA